MVLSIEPFSQTPPPPQFWGALLNPLPLIALLPQCRTLNVVQLPFSAGVIDGLLGVHGTLLGDPQGFTGTHGTFLTQPFVGAAVPSAPSPR